MALRMRRLLWILGLAALIGLAAGLFASRRLLLRPGPRSARIVEAERRGAQVTALRSSLARRSRF